MSFHYSQRKSPQGKAADHNADAFTEASINHLLEVSRNGSKDFKRIRFSSHDFYVLMRKMIPYIFEAIHHFGWADYVLHTPQAGSKTAKGIDSKGKAQDWTFYHITDTEDYSTYCSSWSSAEAIRNFRVKYEWIHFQEFRAMNYVNQAKDDEPSFTQYCVLFQEFQEFWPFYRVYSDNLISLFNSNYARTARKIPVSAEKKTRRAHFKRQMESIIQGYKFSDKFCAYYFDHLEQPAPRFMKYQGYMHFDNPVEIPLIEKPKPAAKPVEDPTEDKLNFNNGMDSSTLGQDEANLNQEN